jgi:hypothetical protein
MLTQCFPSRHWVLHIGHTFRRRLNGGADYSLLVARRRDDHLRARERDMSDSDDLTAMNDPDFLAEYGRARDTLEALTDRMRRLTEEFDRRAGAKWASASQG